MHKEIKFDTSKLTIRYIKGEKTINVDDIISFRESANRKSTKIKTRQGTFKIQARLREIERLVKAVCSENPAIEIIRLKFWRKVTGGWLGLLTVIMAFMAVFIFGVYNHYAFHRSYEIRGFNASANADIKNAHIAAMAYFKEHPSGD